MLSTSEIPFTSSDHGTKRRFEREIAVRDLQAAVKYGTKKLASSGSKEAVRWKYTYGDIVYITDSTSRKEITSWASELPLTRVQIPARYDICTGEARIRIKEDFTIVTSHTVIVVDMSGSMRKSDMNGHRTRARGAYYNLAMEFVAARLHPISSGMMGGTSVTFTDIVTLIEMRDQPDIVFENEPLSWILFNTFVDLSEFTKGAHHHGNYYPSLETAFGVLIGTHIAAKCALALFFFSDGSPSDYTTAVPSKKKIDMDKQIKSLVEYFCKVLSTHLTFTTFGFGKSGNDFDILKMISTAAKEAGAVSTYGYSCIDGNLLGKILTSTSESLTSMRAQLSCLCTGNNTSDERRFKTNIEKAIYNPSTAFNSNEWTYYMSLERKSSFVKKYRLDYVENIVTHYYVPKLIESPMLSDSVGIAVRKKYFGEGAERIVFQMSEINFLGEFIGLPLVAKQSKYEQTNNKLSFLRCQYKRFMKAQRQAEKEAKKFNAHLDNGNISRNIPRIQFLSCFIYECQVDDVCTGQREFSFLSEKQINPQNYKKWNDNAGGVDGQRKVNNAVYQENLYLAPKEDVGADELRAFLPRLEEGNEEEENEDDEEGDDDDDDDDDFDRDENKDEEKEETKKVNSAPMSTLILESNILECDIPQAFTHFTHIVSQRRQMICDIQGVLSLIDGFPVFELTDPCIHSIDRKYGRTDKGREGFYDFFRTHKCNPVCTLLKIHEQK